MLKQNRIGIQDKEYLACMADLNISLNIYELKDTSVAKNSLSIKDSYIISWKWSDYRLVITNENKMHNSELQSETKVIAP